MGRRQERTSYDYFSFLIFCQQSITVIFVFCHMEMCCTSNSMCGTSIILERIKFIRVYLEPSKGADEKVVVCVFNAAGF